MMYDVDVSVRFFWVLGVLVVPKKRKQNANAKGKGNKQHAKGKQKQKQPTTKGIWYLM
jgi:hypothetical protein